MDSYLAYSNTLLTYTGFNNEINKNKKIMIEYLEELNKIKDYTMNFKKLLELGHLMKCFYILNDDENIVNCIKFCFGFNGYLDNLSNIKNLITKGKINFCKFNKDKMIIKNSYFAGLIDKKPVKNSIQLKNNIIITGPNAAGKTTLLKSVLFNTLLNQQLGCGCYTKATVKLYDELHCYINIPDTGGRDSLFQSESRRCKDIIDSISSSNKNHLCVFDELYSGTNPYEAIASGYSYLRYLDREKRVNFVLTTHYTDLCKRLENKTIKNYSMEINNQSSDKKNFKYTYKMIDGISEVKGGNKVLKDLDYPDDIINNMNDVLENIKI